MNPNEHNSGNHTKGIQRCAFCYNGIFMDKHKYGKVEMIFQRHGLTAPAHSIQLLLCDECYLTMFSLVKSNLFLDR